MSAVERYICSMNDVTVFSSEAFQMNVAAWPARPSAGAPATDRRRRGRSCRPRRRSGITLCRRATSSGKRVDDALVERCRCSSRRAVHHTPWRPRPRARYGRLPCFVSSSCPKRSRSPLASCKASASSLGVELARRDEGRARSPCTRRPIGPERPMGARRARCPHGQGRVVPSRRAWACEGPSKSILSTQCSPLTGAPNGIGPGKPFAPTAARSRASSNVRRDLVAAHELRRVEGDDRPLDLLEPLELDRRVDVERLVLDRRFELDHPQLGLVDVVADRLLEALHLDPQQLGLAEGAGDLVLHLVDRVDVDRAEAVIDVGRTRDRPRRTCGPSPRCRSLSTTTDSSRPTLDPADVGVDVGDTLADLFVDSCLGGEHAVVDPILGLVDALADDVRHLRLLARGLRGDLVDPGRQPAEAHRRCRRRPASTPRSSATRWRG